MSQKQFYRWYVYALVDPRNDTPFYIGKGQKKRIHAHKREAEHGVCSHKCNKIREIIKNCGDIQAEYRAFFSDEKAAYDYETDLIEEIGLENLTNVMPGGYGSWSDRVIERRLCKPHIPKPWTPSAAMEFIQKLAGHFAFWLKHSDGGRRQFELVYNCDPIPRFRQAVSKTFHGKMAKEAFSKAVEDENNCPKLVDLFKQYGIALEFSHGG